MLTLADRREGSLSVKLLLEQVCYYNIGSRYLDKVCENTSMSYFNFTVCVCVSV